MGGSYSKTQGTRPFFFGGPKQLTSQEQYAAQAIESLAQQVLGGAPSAGVEAMNNRSIQQTIGSAARAGFSERDPITQARLSAVESSRIGAEEAQRNELMKMLFSPAGSIGGGSFSMGGGKQ